LAVDGGLFIPEEIPSLPRDWESKWSKYSFSELAYEILSLYISPSEIPPADLKEIINRSYSTFRAPETTPLVTLNEKDNLYLLELFHGPTFAFKDVALQFLGNLFEYFLVRRNKGKTGKERHHLTVVGATSGDTGSAAIYGLRGKKDVSVFILHPKGRVSPVQEAQMTTVLDANVHNLAVEGTFDDCQVSKKKSKKSVRCTHLLSRILSRLSSGMPRLIRL
jgi:threonine synthase